MARGGVLVSEIARRFNGHSPAIWKLIERSGESADLRKNYSRLRRESRAIFYTFRDENRKAIKAWKAVESAWNLRECVVCGTIYKKGIDGFVCSDACRGRRFRATNPSDARKSAEKMLIKGKTLRIVERESRRQWFMKNPRPCLECGHPISADKLAKCNRAVFCSALCHGRRRARRPEYIALKKAIYIRDRDSGKTNKQKADYYFNKCRQGLPRTFATGSDWLSSGLAVQSLPTLNH
jgi:predicted nucleic acid-binding Zn ribbon protein